MSITQEDIDKAVNEAVTPLQAELDTLRQFKENVESKDAVNAVREELAAEIEAEKAKTSDLQSKLDTAVAEATQAKAQHDDLIAWLNEQAEQAQREAEVEALKKERSDQVRALEIFPDDYIEENAQRYAEMTEESFEAAMADWKAVKAAKTANEGGEEEEEGAIPQATTFVATRDDEGTKPKSHLRSVMNLRREGIDPRRIAK